MTTTASGACSLAIIEAMKPPMPEPTTTMSASSVMAGSTTTPMPLAFVAVGDSPPDVSPPFSAALPDEQPDSNPPAMAPAPNRPAPARKLLRDRPSDPNKVFSISFPPSLRFSASSMRNATKGTRLRPRVPSLKWVERRRPCTQNGVIPCSRAGKAHAARPRVRGRGVRRGRRARLKHLARRGRRAQRARSRRAWHAPL